MDRPIPPLQAGGDGKSRANDAVRTASYEVVARLVALRADQITTDAPGVLEAMFAATQRP